MRLFWRRAEKDLAMKTHSCVTEIVYKRILSKRCVYLCFTSDFDPPIVKFKTFFSIIIFFRWTNLSAFSSTNPNFFLFMVVVIMRLNSHAIINDILYPGQQLHPTSFSAPHQYSFFKRNLILFRFYAFLMPPYLLTSWVFLCKDPALYWYW